MTVKCIIFDLDDTLVDSEVLCNTAFYNLVPNLTENFDHFSERNRGQKLSLILEYIEDVTENALPKGFEAKYRTEVARLFDRYLEPNPSVRKMLNELSYPLCVASSGPMAKVKQALRVTNLREYFGDNLFSSYDIGSWKPDPGLFLVAAHEMGFPPEACVVIEDSLPGVAAAKAAGMNVLRCRKSPTNKTTDDIPEFDDMNDLPSLIDNIEL